MTQDTRPFWQRPLPPIPGRDDPLEDFPSSNGTDTDPLADDPLAEPETVMADGAAPADDDPVTKGDQSSPQARPVTTQIEPPRPVLSIVEAQRRLVEVQMRCARATDRQRKARGNVALALEKFQRATMQTQTQSDLIRQHIESENEQRRLRAEGKLPQRGGHRRLGSEIDRFAFATRAMGRGAGGGGAFRRGARPASARTPK